MAEPLRIPAGFRSIHLPLVTLLVLAVAALFVPGPVQGQEQKPADAPTIADTNDFVMAVKVVDAEFSTPVPGVTVFLGNFMPSALAGFEWRQVTDAQGAAMLKVPARLTEVFNLSLVASNSVALQQVDWYAHPNPVRAVLQREYTFRLPRLGTIGGFVRDERGAPLVGIRVAPWGTGVGSAWSGVRNSDGRPREYSNLQRSEAATVRTDVRGFWVFTNVPADIATVYLDVARPDGGRGMFMTPSPNNHFGAQGNATTVSLDALRATNEVLVLKDGVTLRGVVVNEAGKPVAGARLNERSGNFWNTPVETNSTDAQGQFVLPHRLGTQYILTAEAPGYALGSKVVNVSPDAADSKIVLRAAQPLKLRLLDEAGQPVVGAEVTLPEYRNRGHLFTWKGTSDGEGRLSWSSAPLQRMGLQIGPTNFPMQMARVESRDAEQVVRILKERRQEIAVRVRALDAEDRKPVAKFSVWRDLRPNSGFSEAEWNGAAGEFKGVLRQSDFPRDSGGGVFRLQVLADGYAPATVDMAYLDEGDFDATVLLRKSKPPVGVVRLPDGQPATNARVLLLSEESSIHLYMNQQPYLQPGTRSFTTTNDGAFRFDGAADEQLLVVKHDAGFAGATVGEMKKTGVIQLQPYARVEGSVAFAGKPLANMYVVLKAPILWRGNNTYNIHYSVNADDSGAFVFTNVPPGDYMLYRMPQIISGMGNTESHRMFFAVGSGEQKRVEYTLGGRSVVARMESDGDVNWQNDAHTLTLKMPSAPEAPSYYSFADADEFQKAVREHGHSKVVLDYERKRQVFQVLIDRDGNLRGDDILPGTYELSITVTKPSPAGRQSWERSGEVLGSLKREVTIPAGEAGSEFDLGVLPIEIKAAEVVASGPVAFKADQFDGKAFDLTQLRGRPAVVAFWGKWAPGSLQKLEGLQAALAGMDKAARPALVSVNLDANSDEARGVLSNLADGWTHARLAGAAQFEVTERLGIDTVPSILLLDREGRVRGRDLDGKRLASALRRFSSPKN